MAAPKPGDSAVLLVGALGELLQLLRTEGYQLVDPTIRDGAIVHAEILGIEDLPAGWTEDRRPGCIASFAVERRRHLGSPLSGFGPVISTPPTCETAPSSRALLSTSSTTVHGGTMSSWSPGWTCSASRATAGRSRSFPSHTWIERSKLCVGGRG